MLNEIEGSFGLQVKVNICFGIIPDSRFEIIPECRFHLDDCSFPFPGHCRGRLASEPDVIPLGYFYSSYIESNRNDGIDTKETLDNINRFITSNTII